MSISQFRLQAALALNSGEGPITMAVQDEPQADRNNWWGNYDCSTILKMFGQSLFYCQLYMYGERK